MADLILSDLGATLIFNNDKSVTIDFGWGQSKTINPTETKQVSSWLNTHIEDLNNKKFGDDNVLTLADLGINITFLQDGSTSLGLGWFGKRSINKQETSEINDWLIGNLE